MEYLEQKMDEINAIYEELTDLLFCIAPLHDECLEHFTDPPASLSEDDTERIVWKVSDILETCSANISEAVDAFLSATPL